MKLVFFVLGLIILLLMLVFTISRIQHTKYKELYSKNTTPSNFKINFRNLEEGKEFLKNSKIIIVGLVRDCDMSLPNTINFINERLIKHFKDYKVLALENDSKDKTREILLDWVKKDNKVTVLGCGKNVDRCVMHFPPTIVHDGNTRRINKMVHLRNILQQELRNPEYSDFDFVLILDFDLNGNLYEDGLFDTGSLLKNDSTIDCVCSTGLILINNELYYYDSYAHEDENTKKYILKDDKDRFLSKPYRYLQLSKKVISCFGGLSIYRLNSLIKNDYCTYKNQTYKKDETICEHVCLNEKLRNVYLNENMIFIVNVPIKT